MKRFVIELANWKKEDMKKTRKICIFPENLQTEIEAAEAICKISPWIEGDKA